MEFRRNCAFTTFIIYMLLFIIPTRNYIFGAVLKSRFQLTIELWIGNKVPQKLNSSLYYMPCNRRVVCREAGTYTNIHISEFFLYFQCVSWRFLCHFGTPLFIEKSHLLQRKWLANWKYSIINFTKVTLIWKAYSCTHLFSLPGEIQCMCIYMWNSIIFDQWWVRTVGILRANLFSSIWLGWILQSFLPASQLLWNWGA